MIGRPSLLVMTAVAAGLATVANAVGLAGADEAGAPAKITSRLGVAIADDTSARDQAATRRGRTLDLREQAVRAAEMRLKASAGASNPAAAPPPATATAGTPTPDQFDDLARIYQAMKPAAAAPVMEQLDLDVQMRVAQRMRERSTAMIMAAMTPKGAAALTMAMARRQAYARPPAGKPQGQPGAGSASSGAGPRSGSARPR
ncbi:MULTISPECIES: MotE family protein [unclassified Sphingomonas]|uniref:MotE family protein n=1 Tax=Sphingomonas sp. PvP015 TaxID=3156388 RepID=UPI0033939090